MKDTKKMENVMEWENFTTRMEECMMVIGRIIKWKDMENYIINQVFIHIIKEKLHTKETGYLTNSQDVDSSIIKIQNLYNNPSITPILMKLMNIGPNMKVNLIKT